MIRKWGEWYRDSQGNLIKDFPVHPGQVEILNSTARFTAAIAGTGGGKTSLIPLWLMQQIQRKPQGNFICVSPTFTMLNKTLLKELKETFSGMTDFEGEHNQGAKLYTTPTGAKIHLYSADDPRHMQGLHADGAVIDECGFLKREVFEIVRQRTNKNKAPVLLTSTPYLFNWLYYDVYLKAKAGDENYRVVNFKSIDNPSYNREEYDLEKQRLPDWRFRMLYDGEFTRPDGLVYPDLEGCLIEQAALPKDMTDAVFVGGLDFGFNDPMVALAGFVKDSCLYLVYEKYKRGHTIDDFCKVCRVKGCKCQPIPKDIFWSCDSSRPDSIKDLKRLDYNAKKCKKYAGSVQDNIDYVNGLIHTGKLKILSGAVTSLINEANLYGYTSTEQEGIYSDKPSDKDNHACDALAYLCSEVKRRRLL